jgi:Ca2+-binding RTX toxin-like protein
MAVLSVGPGQTYATIAEALLDAVSGDTIFLASGYSGETVTINVSGITIQGDASSTGIVLNIASGIDGVTLTGDAPIDVSDSASNSTITGNDGDNEIFVNGGTDSVSAGGGDDRLIVDYSASTGTTTGNGASSFTGAGVGTVTITGGAFEHYTILMGTGVNTITTAGGDDIIIGEGIAANTIVAGEGNNEITTGAGIDTINTGSGDDRILSGDGASTIVTTGGDNVIIGGNGIDTILVGDGADIILAGDGANTITGTGGDKHILTGIGIDTVTLGDGNNQIVTGEGASTIAATHGDNVVCTGAGVDTITLGDGDNLVDAGDGANTVAIGGGSNAVWGGSGIDTITVGLAGTVGNNYVDGGGGPANTLTTGGGNDTVVSGLGVDTITTGGGDDLILVYGAADVIDAGAGEDTLVVDYSLATTDVTNTISSGSVAAGYAGTLAGMGAASFAGVENFDITSGSGNDNITGGDGDDIIDTGTGDDVVNAGGGSDYIYGNGGDTIHGGEGGPTDSDTLNLGFGNEANTTIIYNELEPISGLYVPTIGNAVSESGIVTFTSDGSTLEFFEIENIVYDAPLDPTITIRAPDPAMCTVPCFTPGTSICTLKGSRLVESLEVGDLVLTRDNGFKPIVWIGVKRVEGTQLQENNALQPICIRRGSLGEDCPNRDMMVSRQHRMLMTGPRSEILFGSNEVIVKANDLVSMPGIYAGQLAGVTYVHIMFDQHEIVLADEAWTESFQPGDRTVTGLDAVYVEELKLIFPELPEGDRFAHYGAARLSLKSYEAAILVA